ncbi:MAG: alpha/beta hydrolase [Clostridia bacterium]|nr:alpha/beta hydrolase [Clostridia bacterium]
MSERIIKTEKPNIASIPAIVWGEESESAYIFVHGKQSRKEYAEQFAKIAEEKGFQTLSFDLPEHGERTDGERLDVWSGKKDLSEIADYAFKRWKNLSLFACSIGAYFSLETFGEMPFQKALFLSPIADMRCLVKQMMLWFDVSKERLETEKEIETPVDTLRWDYYNYILTHPVKEWKIPTHILYGGKDNLQSREVIENFCRSFGCELTVSENSEHPFMAEGDEKILEKWYREKI